MLALLDLDETLVDRRAAFLRWAERFAEQHSLQASDLERLVGTDRVVKACEQFFARVAARLPLAGPADDIWRGHRRQMPDLVELFTGVVAELGELRGQG